MTEPNLSYIVVEGVQYVTTEEAAKRLGNDVTPDMIRDWTKRGLLKPAGRYGGRSNIYRLADVAHTEMRTRTERRGRTRRAGELQKIAESGQNLPADEQANSAQKPVKRTRCSILKADASECNKFAVPDAPFRICRDHMREAYLHWQDHLAEVSGFDPTQLPGSARLPGPEPELLVRGQDPRQPFVYYIRFGDRIKIGYTLSVRGRLANLPHDEVLAIEPGALDLERTRHQQFAAHRITSKGEWFRQHPDLLAHIEMLVSHYGTAEAQLQAIGSSVRPHSPMRPPTS